MSVLRLHPALDARLDGGEPDVATWRSFWDDVTARGVGHGEAVAMLASLAARPPGPTGGAALLASLRERCPPPPPLAPTVDVVGTGGGPSRINVSTAAAVVAAAAGSQVLKTGSSARRRPVGSHDLLDRLGVARTRSWEQTEEQLDRYGLAFAGDFVHPRPLAALARIVLPLDVRALSGTFNLLGPLLAALPAGVTVAGVSDRRALPLLRACIDGAAPRRYWFVYNAAGMDELLGDGTDVVERGPDDIVYPNVLGVPARAVGVDDLRPSGSDPVDAFVEVLTGRGRPAAVGVVALNAAALLVAGGTEPTWAGAVDRASEAIGSGAAADLLARLRRSARLSAVRVQRG